MGCNDIEELLSVYVNNEATGEEKRIESIFTGSCPFLYQVLS